MNQKKQRLQHNELADWLELRLEHLKPYSTQILLGVLLGIAAIVGIAWWVGQRGTKAGEAWGKLFVASDDARFKRSSRELEQVADEAGVPAAQLWSRQFFADAKLQEGLELSYMRLDSVTGGADEDATATAEAALRKAVEEYDQVVAQSQPGSMLYDRAVMGRSIAYEALGESAQALEGYESVIASGPDSPMAVLATRYRDRLAAFENPDAFVAEFAAWRPNPSLGGGSGMPTIPGMPGGFPGMPGGEADTGSETGDGLLPAPDISFPDVEIPGIEVPGAEVPGIEVPGEETPDISLDPPADGTESSDSGVPGEPSSTEPSGDQPGSEGTTPPSDEGDTSETGGQ